MGQDRRVRTHPSTKIAEEAQEFLRHSASSLPSDSPGLWGKAQLLARTPSALSVSPSAPRGLQRPADLGPPLGDDEPDDGVRQVSLSILNALVRLSRRRAPSEGDNNVSSAKHPAHSAAQIETARGHGSRRA